MRVAAVFLLVCAPLGFVWPLHAVASRIEPDVLGVPFSLIWVVLGQLTAFAGLLLLYFTEE